MSANVKGMTVTAEPLEQGEDYTHGEETVYEFKFRLYCSPFSLSEEEQMQIARLMAWHGQDELETVAKSKGTEK